MNSNFEEFKASRLLIRDWVFLAGLVSLLLIVNIILYEDFKDLMLLPLCVTSYSILIWRLIKPYIRISDEKIIFLCSPFSYRSLKWEEVKSIYWHDDSFLELKLPRKRTVTVYFDNIDEKQRESFIKSIKKHLMQAKVEELNPYVN